MHDLLTLPIIMRLARNRPTNLEPPSSIQYAPSDAPASSSSFSLASPPVSPAALSSTLHLHVEQEEEEQGGSIFFSVQSKPALKQLPCKLHDRVHGTTPSHINETCGVPLRDLADDVCVNVTKIVEDQQDSCIFVPEPTGYRSLTWKSALSAGMHHFALCSSRHALLLMRE